MSGAGQGSWQAIQTAPKDGRNILVVNGSWVAIAHWDNAAEAWMVSTNHYQPMPSDQQPTDWQPLPSPPEAPQ